MARATKILFSFLIILLTATVISCAPAKKNTYFEKRKKASHVNTEQMGRNRYFFSSGYQKKLTHSYKKKTKKRF